MESQEKASEVLDAVLKGEKVVVEDSGRFGELEQVGYGEREGKKLVLKDYEALYLLFTRQASAQGRAGEEGHLRPPGRDVPGQVRRRVDEVHHLQGPEVEGIRRQGRFRVRDRPQGLREGGLPRQGGEVRRLRARRGHREGGRGAERVGQADNQDGQGGDRRCDREEGRGHLLQGRQGELPQVVVTLEPPGPSSQS